MVHCGIGLQAFAEVHGPHPAPPVFLTDIHHRPGAHPEGQGNTRAHLHVHCTTLHALPPAGFLLPFLYYIILLKAYDLLPAQVAQPLNYTWALTLAYLSVPLLRQKLHPREIVAGIICYSGVVVIVSRGQMPGLESLNPLGVILALVSTIVWSLSWITSTRDDRDPVESLLTAFLFGLPFILAACLLTSSVVVEDVRGLAGAAYVGVFEMGITFVFWLNALKLSKNTARVGNLIFLSPFISLLFIHFLVGEEILVPTFAGLALIVAGLMVQGTGSSSP